MRLFTPAICAALALAATATHAAKHHARDTDGGDRAAVAKLEQDWLKALRKHDTAALDRILADDFVDVSTHGEFRGKPDELSGGPTSPDIQEALQDVRVRVYGNTAIANGVNVVHSQSQGWTAEVAFTDVFVREHGRWRAVSSQETLRPQGPTSPP